MTNRDRLMAVLKGEPVDLIPWIPRTLLWYQAHRLEGTLPEGKELDTSKVSGITSELADLKLIGVRKKPDSLIQLFSGKSQGS